MFPTLSPEVVEKFAASARAIDDWDEPSEIEGFTYVSAGCSRVVFRHILTGWAVKYGSPNTNKSEVKNINRTRKALAGANFDQPFKLHIPRTTFPVKSDPTVIIQEFAADAKPTKCMLNCWWDAEYVGKDKFCDCNQTPCHAAVLEEVATWLANFQISDMHYNNLLFSGGEYWPVDMGW